MIHRNEIAKLSGWLRQIPEPLLAKARELRKTQTPTEEVLWQCLRNRQLNGLKFRRQHNIGQFIADFYCHQALLVIEVDGEVHNDQIEKDNDRDQWMATSGFTVLRVKNNEVLEDLPTVLAKILQAAQPKTTEEPPSYLPSP